MSEKIKDTRRHKFFRSRHFLQIKKNPGNIDAIVRTRLYINQLQKEDIKKIQNEVAEVSCKLEVRMLIAKICQDGHA
jgi:hypothetical protein